jgi:hypothetical protein
MNVLISGTDITESLSKYQGEYCRLEYQIDGKKHKFACGGTIQVIPDEMPYNPLTNSDCGTDSMLGGKI